jgi:hypothetical protein
MESEERIDDEELEATPRVAERRSRQLQIRHL